MTKQSVEIQLNLKGLLRHPSGVSSIRLFMVKLDVHFVINSVPVTELGRNKSMCSSVLKAHIANQTPPVDGEPYREFKPETITHRQGQFDRVRVSILVR